MLFLTSEEELHFNGPIQVLYFFAAWMPYHKKMLIMLDKMEEKYQEAKFFAIDVDYFKKFISRFDVASVPTVIIMKDGKVVKNIEGLVLTSAIKSAFADICKS